MKLLLLSQRDELAVKLVSIIPSNLAFERVETIKELNEKDGIPLVDILDAEAISSTFDRPINLVGNKSHEIAQISEKLTFSVGNVFALDFPGLLLENILSNIHQSYQNSHKFDDSGEVKVLSCLHNQFIPLRKEVYDKLSIYSKYRAGKNIGGDSFDFFQKNGFIYLYHMNVKSYLTSSLIVNHLQYGAGLENKDLSECMEGLLNHLRDSDIDLEGPSNSFQFYILKIDKVSLDYESYSFGDYKIKKSNSIDDNIEILDVNENNFEQAHRNGSLSSKDQWLILSPGVNRYELDIPKVMNFSESEIKELFDIIFMQIQKDDGSPFFDFDATAIYLKVGENGLKMV